MSTYERVQAAAKEWARNFVPGRLTARPVRHVVVLACMDARLDLFRMLGLEVGDAHIVRNAGGRATADAVRSIIVSTAALGTREVVVIHHTECGLLGTTNEEVRATVRELTGADPTEIDFHPFADINESVRTDVAALRSSPYLPAELVVWGAVYEVATGELRTVVPPQHGPVDGDGDSLLP